ncbi:hypothetical protein HDU96_005104 [Phlyctochytrium bullatum]|nr:hypothetical protein HDU96_005104 [Phlyctochytrium bullatum]
MERRYVPRLISELAADVDRRREAEDALASGFPYIEEFFGVAMMCDISGYTSLANELAKRGSRVSGEIITDAVSTYMGSIIDVVASYGGDVIKFLGDAVLIVLKRSKIRKRTVDMLMDVEDEGEYESETDTGLKTNSSVKRQERSGGGGGGEREEKEELEDLRRRTLVCCCHVMSVYGKTEVKVPAVVASVNGASAAAASVETSITLELHIAACLGDLRLVVVGESFAEGRCDCYIAGKPVADIGTILSATQRGEIGASYNLIPDFLMASKVAVGIPKKTMDNVHFVLYNTRDCEAVLDVAAASNPQAGSAAQTPRRQRLFSHTLFGRRSTKGVSRPGAASIRTTNISGSTLNTLQDHAEILTLDVESAASLAFCRRFINPSLAWRIRSELGDGSHIEIENSPVKSRGTTHQDGSPITGKMPRASVRRVMPDNVSGVDASDVNDLEEGLSPFVVQPQPRDSQIHKSPHVSFGNEFRSISVVFMKLPAMADKEISNSFAAAIQVIETNGDGIVHQISVDDKGLSFLFLYGLPPKVKEKSSPFAVKDTLQLCQSLANLGVRPIVCGITTGDVLFSTLGNGRRKDMGYLGKIVNIAARLMCLPPTYHERGENESCLLSPRSTVMRTTRSQSSASVLSKAMFEIRCDDASYIALPSGRFKAVKEVGLKLKGVDANEAIWKLDFQSPSKEDEEEERKTTISDERSRERLGSFMKTTCHVGNSLGMEIEMTTLYFGLRAVLKDLIELYIKSCSSTSTDKVWGDDRAILKRRPSRDTASENVKSASFLPGMDESNPPQQQPPLQRTMTQHFKPRSSDDIIGQCEVDENGDLRRSTTLRRGLSRASKVFDASSLFKKDLTPPRRAVPVSSDEGSCLSMSFSEKSSGAFTNPSVRTGIKEESHLQRQDSDDQASRLLSTKIKKGDEEGSLRNESEIRSKEDQEDEREIGSLTRLLKKTDTFPRSNSTLFGMQTPKDRHVPLGPLLLKTKTSRPSAKVAPDPDAAYVTIDPAQASLLRGFLSALGESPDNERLLQDVLQGTITTENDAAKEFHGSKTKEIVKQMMLRLLVSASRKVKLLLLFDDCQWFDSLSLDIMLALLASRPHNLAVVLATRPIIESHNVILKKLSVLKTCERIKLTGLQYEEVEQLMTIRLRGLGASFISPEMIQQVYQRSGGAPILVSRLCDVITSQLNKSVVITPNGTLNFKSEMDYDTVLVTSTDAAVTAIFDKLNFEFRNALKTASVFGQTFSVEDLAILLKTNADSLLYLFDRYDDFNFIANGRTQYEVSFRHITIQT